MSRYTIRSFNPNFQIVIGWDWPMRTYFAQVLDVTKQPGEEGFTRVWVGGTFDEIQSPEALRTPIAAYGDITNEMVATLRTDRGCQ